MSNTMKKVAAIGLSLATVSFLAGNVLVASAQTVSISDLLTQIAALQAQIAAMSGGTVATGASYNFTRDLTVGATGDDVKSLQQFLNGKGYAVATSGAGSVGNESTYFGSKTTAALAKYQAAVGIAPAAGYFGPKTRAYVNSLAAGTTGTTGTTGGTVVVAPSTGLKVTLASDNPAAGSLVSGASRVNVMKFNLTAGTSGAVTVNGLKFTKTGVVSDSGISNAYLVESGKVIAQYSSLSGGVITFNGLNLNVNAGQTRSLSLGIDPSTGLTAGNTIAFAVNAAADVTSVDYSNNAVTASGSYPMNGNTFTITTVSNPSIATLTVASSTVGTSVYAGTSNVLVSQWTLTANNSPIKMSSIKFNVVGSANKNDIQNVKLMINGTQVGSTLATVGGDGTAYFDMSSNPATIQTGSSNMQIYADVMGSPSFNFDFGILNTYDVFAVDSTYNTGVTVTVNGGSTGSSSGHQITINQGAITVSAASNTPTGNIAKGGSGVTLGKFTVYAAGEAVKVKYLDFKLTFTGTTGTISNIVKNISLVDDAGSQVGSTISTPPSSNTCTGYGAAAGYGGSTPAYNDCFGTSSSPINYIVPANTTRVLSLKGDIQTTAAFTTVTAALSGNSSNLQGLSSSQSASSGAASGAALTLATNALTASQNTAMGSINNAKGTQGAKIGSFIFTASSAEGVNVSNLTVTMSASSTDFQNLMAKVGTTQFGTTKNTLTGSDVVTFSGSSPIVVPAGGSATVDVYADILSGASQGTKTALTTLTSCVGTGASTYTSISCSPTSIAGQNVVIAGSPTLTVSASSNTAPTKQVVMGSTSNSVATFRLADTANVENVKIQTLVVTASSTDATAATTPGFENVKLYNGTTLVAGPVSASSTGTGTWVYTFNPTTQPIVPQNGSLELELKGDVASYISGGATSNKTYIFKVSSTSDVTALGVGSNTSATPTISAANGNRLTTLRSKLSLSSATLGATSGRTRVAVDDLAELTFTANSGYDATVNTVSLKFTGLAVSVGTAITADLIDPSTGSAWSSVSSATCTTGTQNSCTASFTFSTIPTISAGTSKTVKVRVNSSSFYNASQTTDSMSVLVNANTDVNWGDGTTTNGLSLESTVVPVTVSNVSYE